MKLSSKRYSLSIGSTTAVGRMPRDADCSRYCLQVKGGRSFERGSFPHTGAPFSCLIFSYVPCTGGEPRLRHPVQFCFYKSETVRYGFFREIDPRLNSVAREEFHAGTGRRLRKPEHLRWRTSLASGIIKDPRDSCL